jgi:uncharacterized protein (DUF2147 family)
MKKTTLLLMTLLFCETLFSQINADAILGTWLTGSGKGKVHIYKEGNKYNGKIVWLKEPNREDGTAKLDRNNSDKALQSRPIMGLNMLKDFTFEKDKWVGGTIYDPENGKTYSCKITYRDGKLDVRGFIGISLIGRTDTWFKVPDIK